MARISGRKRGVLCFFDSGHSDLQLHWRYRSAAGSCSSGTGAQPIPAVDGDRVWFAVPAARCLFHTLSGSHIPLSALRWQLEGIALGDVETLHITLLASEPRQQHLVAIDAGWLRSALDVIAQRGFTPDYALPDVLLLPQGFACQQHNMWLAHHAPFAGIGLPLADLQHFQSHEATLAGLPLMAWPELPLRRPPLHSLLHSEFTPPVRWGNSLRVLAAAALLSVAALPAVPLWQGWQLKQAAASLQQQVLQRYQLDFPTQTPADPVAAFHRQLRRLESSITSSGLLSLLADSQTLLAKLGETPLKTLEWDAQSQQLRLHFATALAPENLAAPPAIRISWQDTDKMILERKP